MFHKLTNAIQFKSFQVTLSMRKYIKEFLFSSSYFPIFREWEQCFNAYAKRVHEPDYYNLPIEINGGLVIDIGANIGQSLISFRRLFPASKIIAFEPNPSCMETLKKISQIVGGDLELKNFGLGDSAGAMNFYVPVIRQKIELLQEGSFDKTCFDQQVTIDRISEKFRLKSMSIQILKLDDFKYDCKLIKIDVQGFEYQVIKGALRTIEMYKPTIIVEKDERNDNKIRNILHNLGYSSSDGLTNHIFIHTNTN